MIFDNNSFSILIVDDENSVRLTLGELLRLEGYQISTAVDGNEAIKKLRAANKRESSSPFDLILLDLKMPGRDGLDVLRFITRSHISIEVILLTAHGSMQSAIEALRHGAQDYLLKPVSPSKLITSVRKCLQHRVEQRNQQVILFQLETAINALRKNQRTELQTTHPSQMNSTNNVEKLEISDGIWFVPELREISSQKISISLTATENKLFSLMIQNPEKIYSYSEFIKFLHGYEISHQEASGLIRPMISRLRKKLSAFPEGKNWITNVRGRGYTFSL